jgi:hypothetical protein
MERTPNVQNFVKPTIWNFFPCFCVVSPTSRPFLTAGIVAARKQTPFTPSPEGGKHE